MLKLHSQHPYYYTHLLLAELFLILGQTEDGLTLGLSYEPWLHVATRLDSPILCQDIPQTNGLVI